VTPKFFAIPRWKRCSSAATPRLLRSTAAASPMGARRRTRCPKSGAVPLAPR
jgi:hypothetical protein